jgi:hypothetical protein
MHIDWAYLLLTDVEERNFVLAGNLDQSDLFLELCIIFRIPWPFHVKTYAKKRTEEVSNNFKIDFHLPCHVDLHRLLEEHLRHDF